MGKMFNLALAVNVFFMVGFLLCSASNTRTAIMKWVCSYFDERFMAVPP